MPKVTYMWICKYHSIINVSQFSPTLHNKRENFICNTNAKLWISSSKGQSLALRELPWGKLSKRKLGQGHKMYYSLNYSCLYIKLSFSSLLTIRSLILFLLQFTDICQIKWSGTLTRALACLDNHLNHLSLTKSKIKGRNRHIWYKWVSYL